MQSHSCASEEEVRRQVDRAAAALEQIMEDIETDIAVSKAVSDIVGDGPDDPETVEAEAISSAVRNNLEGLDGAFLEALTGYADAVRRDDVSTARRLDAIRAELLAQVAAKLPASLRLLDSLGRMASSEVRVGLIRRSADGGGEGVPACSLAEALAGANQIIDDMEERLAPPDRILLARLCLAREELSVVAAERGELDNPRSDFAQMAAAHQAVLPQAAAAFTKELMSVGSAQRRTALLRQALRADLEPPAPPAGGTGPLRTKHPGGDPNRVTPGRLLACLAALQSGLARQGAPADDPRRARLESMRLALLRLLEDVQAGSSSPKASSDSPAASAGSARS
ncbi:hypothetical protein WJX81_002695 [Elliptochloris bilobata]|uniref:Uncharacterized protein n=1 Tax=Elliptochloris bilobata TaxID=381761 RepID=A0AAW1RVZ6_9CHLO